MKLKFHNQEFLYIGAYAVIYVEPLTVSTEIYRCPEHSTHLPALGVGFCSLCGKKLQPLQVTKFINLSLNDLLLDCGNLQEFLPLSDPDFKLLRPDLGYEPNQSYDDPIRNHPGKFLDDSELIFIGRSPHDSMTHHPSESPDRMLFNNLHLFQSISSDTVLEWKENFQINHKKELETLGKIALGIYVKFGVFPCCFKGDE